MCWIFRNIWLFIISMAAIALSGCGMQVESAQDTFTALSITPASLNIILMQTAQLRAVASNTNGNTTDVTSTAEWTSSTPAVATVDGQGILTCQNSGSSLISALSGGVTAKTSLTCSTPQTTDIHLSSMPEIIRSESPYQYQMMADYSDGTTKDVSANTSWVTDPSIASISSNGLVLCNHPGDATVSGTFSGMITQSSFTCVLHPITPNPGFVESAKTFDGPFASWTNVKTAFGAKGDGVTDDTSALQAALNSLSQSTPVLWIPNGTYLITRPLTISGIESITILGEDPLTTTIAWGGIQGGTMFTLSGVAGFNLGRITWDGRGATRIAIEVTWDDVSNYYPTRNLIHDSRIYNSAIGIQTGYAGETTVDRVHFDHNSLAAIDEGDYDSLNFNIIDSLFTDNTIGITNDWGGAFNVTNSVFVRSTSTDLALNNTGPFSIRNNLSVDSQQFFWTGATSALANVIIQGNIISHPASMPMVDGTPGALMLLDNQFVNLNPSFNIMGISGSPRSFISVGNTYSVSQPFGPACGQCSGVGIYTSIDEATRSYDPILSLTVPTEIYVPPNSHRPVIEVPVGANGYVIQAAIDSAIAVGGIVHLPAGNFNIYQTLKIPPNASVGILGDGILSTLFADANLQGPILSSYGKSVQLEDFGFYSSSTSSMTDQLELHVPDIPSSRIICDECMVAGADIEVDGMDDATIEYKSSIINGTNSGTNWPQIIHGGIARQNEIETLGSLGEYMTSSSEYQVDRGGHLLIGDGWHDGGQGNTQFVLTGDGSVTQQGGAVLGSPSSPAMILGNYKGRLSLLGSGTNSYISVDARSTANVFVGATDQFTGNNPVINSGTSASITEISDSSTTTNSLQNMINYSDTPTTPTYIEQMMSMARTQILSPRKPIGFDSTTVKMTRVTNEINYGGAGVRIMDSVASRVAGSYSIMAANEGVTPLQPTCGSGEVSMAGIWTLQDGGDGFYGLLSRGGILSEGITIHANGDGDGVAMVGSMSSARDRWIVTQIGDGSVKITNRATGNVLTKSSSGCAYVASDTGTSNQQWLVDGVKGD